MKTEEIKRSEDMDIGLYELSTDDFKYLMGSRGLKQILALDYHISKVKQRVKGTTKRG